MFSVCALIDTMRDKRAEPYCVINMLLDTSNVSRKQHETIRLNIAEAAGVPVENVDSIKTQRMTGTFNVDEVLAKGADRRTPSIQVLDTFRAIQIRDEYLVFLPRRRQAQGKKVPPPMHDHESEEEEY